MTRVAVFRTISAPVETVFKAVSDIENLPSVSPDVAAIEFLSESRSGVGTRFRETRLMRGKEVLTELDVTEFVENERARMVTDSHGTVWDTLFTVNPSGAQTELEITMDARPHKLLPKLLNPLMKGMFRKGMEKYIDQVREYCEGAAH